VSHPDSVSRYDPGDLIRMVATFVSTDNVTPADPSTIFLFVKDASGIVGTYQYGAAGASIIRVGVGAYARDHSIPFSNAAAGSWHYTYLGTGGVQAVSAWSFLVNRSFVL
jgi:hypothetical protein